MGARTLLRMACFAALALLLPAAAQAQVKRNFVNLGFEQPNLQTPGCRVYIADDQTVGTSDDCTTVFALQVGEGGLLGLTAPGGLTVERVGSLETKDATRTRIKWYGSLALFNALKLARLTGVRP